MPLKNLRLIVPVLVLAMIVTVLLATQDPKPVATKLGGCSENYRADRTIKIGSQSIKTEVAQTAREREKGLSGRACITDDQGMVFTFEKPGHYSFWMKDMNFPIDIIWIGADRLVVGIEKDVLPSTYPDSFINKDKPAQYVLELKSGRADGLGLNLGTKVNF